MGRFIDNDDSFIKILDITVDNDLKYNPYRDSKGRFDEGPDLKPIKKMVSEEENQEILKEARKRRQERYPGRKKGESFSDYAQRWVENNEEEAIKKYQSRILDEFDTPWPNIVSADDAKFIIPGFTPERSADYHEPSSTFAKTYYKMLLNQGDTTHLPITFTAGGTGAGKSTALKGTTKEYGSYAAVYDGNMAGFDSAKGKIEAALATGRDVEIFFVDRHPVTAFKFGVLPRIALEGRAVTIKDHLETHIQSREAVTRISEHFKDNDRVSVRVIDNNGGLGEAHEVSLDNLTKIIYNKEETRKELEHEADLAKEDGRINEEVWRLIKDPKTGETSDRNSLGESQNSTTEGNDETDRSFGIGTKRFRELNALRYNPYRDAKGRFASGPLKGGFLDFSKATPKQFSKTVKQLFPSPKWTKEEIKATDFYTATEYVDINKWLVNPDDKSILVDEDHLAEVASTLESAMRNKLPQDAVLYRGFSVPLDQEVKVGSEITYPGFNSATFFEDKGIQFAKRSATESGGERLPVMLKIKAKKGQEGLMPILQGDKVGLRGNEAEFILPPNISFKVLSKSEKDEYEEYEVEIA